MIETLQQPWHWFFGGLSIFLVMTLLLFLGKSFGVSSSMSTLCSIAGAGKKFDFFDFDWKSRLWNISFVVGALLGGFVAAHYLMDDAAIAISASTLESLQNNGIAAPKPGQILPPELFNSENIFSLKGLIILITGGFFVGFGARFAGGCTSGHAISGLSNLQLPSLISVVGFFIGGLFMSHFLLPLIFELCI